MAKLAKEDTQTWIAFLLGLILRMIQDRIDSIHCLSLAFRFVWMDGTGYAEIGLSCRQEHLDGPLK